MAAELNWRRSSYSNESGTGGCIECANFGRSTLVRDSKDQTGPRVSVDSSTWSAFVRLARTF